MQTKFTHTLNPVTGREIRIGGPRFNALISHGYAYDIDLNRLYDEPLPPDTKVYVPRERIVSPSNRWALRDGLVAHRLRADGFNYDEKDCEWRKGPISRPPLHTDSDSDIDIDEYEYDEDGHAIFPF